MAAPDLFIGIMSGTSLDGIDVAICRFPETAKVDLLHHQTYEWPFELRDRLKLLVSADDFSVDKLTRLNFDLARAYARAVEGSLSSRRTARESIRAIGLHGQTIRHLPGEATWQLGSGTALAAMTRITTVHDFRSADVALGGQGAPLVPMFDLIFLHSTERDRLVTNIGGITNVTYIPKSGERDKLIAYDTGPGNMIIDALMQRCFNKAYDEHGQIARSGRVDEGLLESLLLHPYFTQAPPKSTGRELIDSDFLPRFVTLLGAGYSERDAIATATELTARTLTATANQLETDVEVILSGGGAKNAYLVERISSLLKQNSRVSLSYELGIDAQAKESIAFAYFAKARIDQEIIHLPRTTGASRAVLLGSIAESA